MAKLIPVQYGDLNYPHSMKPSVGEISLRFSYDESDIKRSIEYMKKNKVKYFSLHTQEPHTANEKVKRDIEKNPSSIVIKNNLDNIRINPAYLWSSREWTNDFSKFLEEVSKYFEDENSIKVIELHTPKNRKYIESIDKFVKELKFFYDKTSPIFPKAKFVVENSYEKPILYSVEEINEFSDKIDDLRNENHRIGIALDIPQLFMASKMRDINTKEEEVVDLFERLNKSKHNIKSIHLSGARANKNNGQSHHGDLNTLFHHGHPEGDGEIDRAKSLKQNLLECLYRLLSDENKRYFVPELNGREDSSLKSIISDLEERGVEFDYSSPC